jgi:D-alanyl-lipoteichoic acid acyltransferase DltB (MBOAT superfamily)
MTISQLFIFIGFALFTSCIKKRNIRKWLLLIASVIAIYWIQPASSIRHLDFWLPTAMLTIIGWVYFVSKLSSSSGYRLRSDIFTITVILGLIFVIGSLRYLGPLCCVTSTPPPSIWIVLVSIILVFLLWMFGLWVFPGKTWGLNLLIFILLCLFVIQKNNEFALLVSTGLRSLSGQSLELASSMDISWIGFSYIAFRLIHVLRDRITGRLPEIDLAELITYIIFFPTITAGPIDRIQRFIEDLRADFTLKSPQIILGGKRILIGLFKKFALADSLALIALNPQNAVQVTSTGWTWIMLYAYSFRIYYDFSGYTDIALGIGQLLGFSLPENFNRSYLQTNLTTFWNNWHMTLTNWFRAYFFNPLTRAMRTSKRKLPLWLIIFVAQLSTMVLIGLWHGITWNFVIWGFWHGVGLFIHNRWADLTRPILKLADKSTGIQRLVDSLGVLLTFNYVSLGWLWFVLPNPEISIQVFQKLIGI